MIPTMIAFGLLFGRWWRWTLVAAAVVWPAILVDVIGLSVYLLGGALLGVANAAVGVLVHQALLRLVRLVRAARGRVASASPRG